MALAVLKPLLLLLPCLLLLLLLVPATRARERFLLVRLVDDDGAENNRVAKDQMGNSNGLDKNSKCDDNKLINSLSLQVWVIVNWCQVNALKNIFHELHTCV